MFSSFTAQAQRSAYVDMDKILGSVKEYETAQRELEQQAERWRQEIAKEYDQIETMYREYQVREPLLSDEMRKSKQEEIVNKEKSVKPPAVCLIALPPFSSTLVPSPSPQ